MHRIAWQYVHHAGRKTLFKMIRSLESQLSSEVSQRPACAALLKAAILRAYPGSMGPDDMLPVAV